MQDITYDKSTNFFKLTVDEKEFLFHYLQNVDNSFEDKEFEIYLFYSSDCKENDIFQVKYEKKRLGWIFPVSVFFSTSHKEMENIHFQKYTYVAYKYLILHLEKEGFFKSRDSEEVFIESIIEENIFIFIHSKETIEKTNLSQFKVENFLAGFFLYGFLPCNLNREIKYKSDLVPSLRQSNNIDILKIADSLIDDLFIQNFFLKILPSKNDYIVDFFYAYQIIELLMDKVFSKEIEPLTQDITEKLKSSRLIMDTMHEFKDILSEKNRINLIQHKYIKNNLNTTSLKIACNEFLEKYKKIKYNSVDNELKNYLYSVRNLIFHEYRIVENPDELKKIVYALHELICYLVINFEENIEAELNI